MKKHIWLAMMAIGLVFAVPVGAISKDQKTAIVENCDSIKESLKTVQHQDSKTRVYLGRYYETILSKYITPLNVRLVENNMFDSELMDNQDSFSKMRNTFIIDYVEYQRALEELVAMDCKAEPEGFYEKLVRVRGRRNEVARDTVSLRELMYNQLELVKKLKGKL